MSVTDIYIDIETIPSPCPPSPECIQAPANYKDPEKIAAYRQNAIEDEWRKESLLSHRGRVLCIGWAVDDGEACSVCAEPEGPAIESFWASLCSQLPRESSRSIRWVGFNVTSFDLQWLRHRSFKYGLRDLSYQLPADRYPKNVFDLRSWWLGPDYQGKGKLEEIAAFFGLPGKTDGIDGSKVFDFWRAGQLDEIAAYCRRDVELVRELHQRITG
ncbi:MAG: hypothetical protein FD177_256 [Desulfovibrionaceae bacterium]|nr:MAG: hypothetical protein FD177_256 [Desulfovibrionaceae bacterium]